MPAKKPMLLDSLKLICDGIIHLNDTSFSENSKEQLKKIANLNAQVDLYPVVSN